MNISEGNSTSRNAYFHRRIEGKSDTVLHRSTYDCDGDEYGSGVSGSVGHALEGCSTGLVQLPRPNGMSQLPEYGVLWLLTTAVDQFSGM